LIITVYDLAHKTTTQQNKNSTMKAYIEPQSTDILGGGGNIVFHHAGNKWLKKTSFSSWKVTRTRIAKRDATSFATSLKLFGKQVGAS